MINENKTIIKQELRDLLESDVKKDLHIHTYFSDGALSPEEVIDRWICEGYKLIAVTDHDGIGGSVRGAGYARECGIGFVSGIEFDSEDELGKDMHILGYGFDTASPIMAEALEWIVQERAERNDALMAELNRMGYEVTREELSQVNDGRFTGKPSFAAVLRDRGYVGSVQEAFSTIFREPSIRRIRKKTLPSAEVIDVIHRSGGLAVLAHPMEQRHLSETYAQFRPRLDQILGRMREYGVDGIECYHPSADDVQAETLRTYAEDYGLIVTRGSDFHSDHQRRDFSRYHRP